MSQIRETLFNLLLNTIVQIGFFAIVAAVFSRVIAMARPRHQHFFYLAVLLFCSTAPVINTLWQAPSGIVAVKSAQRFRTATGGPNHDIWSWQVNSKPHEQFKAAPEFQSWIVGIWGIVVLLQLARFSLAVFRIHGLRRGASAIPLSQVGLAVRIIEGNVALLASADIDDPVTIGAFRPAILLPSRVLPDLNEQELSAVLAHEFEHIRRRDFPIHILCELISLPVAWHPGIAYLMSKISQTRELACDDYAAASLGKRDRYARTLLRLASLCLHAPRGNAVGLGIFDDENLETRIMTLTNRRLPLSRAALIGLALATSITFGASEVLAQATSLQSRSERAGIAEKFAGTWHWMFDGRSFATMILVREGESFTGSVTGSRIALNADGDLSQADPSDDSAPKPISKANLEGSALHVAVKDGDEPFEFVVTLNDATHAQILPKGAPPNMKPIRAEKAQ